MKKSIRKNAVLCIIGVLAICAAVFAAASLYRPSSAKAATISFAELKEEYSAGDKLQIPDSAAIEYNDELLTVDKCYLVRPDGSALSGKSYNLDLIGEYTLVMESSSKGQKITARKAFKVLKDYYSLSDDVSTVSYGELNATYKRKGMNTGVIAELTEGATLTIAEPINVYAEKKVDLLTFNLARMDNAVNYISIRIVDCYNPDIEIDLQYWKRFDSETYLKAGPKGAGLLGLVASDNGQYAIGGGTYSRGIFGSNTRSNRSVNGTYNNLTISFENTDDGKIRIWSNVPEHESNPNGDDRLITEINNDKLYSSVFPGFTTGEVNVSITATGFNNVKTARVEIGSIDGRKNEQLNTFGSYIDTVAPDIKLGSSDDTKIVAGTETKVPEAVAYDASGLNGGVDYTVWYNYSDPGSRKIIAVKDGKFTAKELGTYTVECRAEDVYGNKTVKTVDLLAVKRAAEGISLSMTKEITEAKIGSSVDLTGYVVNSLCKTYTVEIFVTAPSGKVTDVTKTARDFGVDETGTYKAKYVYSDAFYSGEYLSEFESVSGGDAVFEKKSIPVPEYFIAGATYSVEDIKAYYYEGATKKSAELVAYVSYDGGAYKQISAEGFVVEKASSLKLKLAVKSNETIFVESGEAAIADVGYNTTDLDVAKYFVGDLTGKAVTGYTLFTSSKNGDASMKFVNPLLASRFSVSYEIANEETLAGMDIVLTDYYDRSNSAVISLTDGETDAKGVFVNGAFSALPTSWKGSAYVVSYDGENLNFDGSPVGADFGFTSDLCLFEIRFRTVTKGFKFKLSALCNQPFGARKTDDVNPLVSAALPDAVMPVNAEYTTDIPCFADVLSPSSRTNAVITVTFTKFGESGVTRFTDVTGKTMSNLPANQNYVVKFTEFGRYVFTYSYTDGAGRRGSLQRLVYVYDLVAPVISFKNKPTSAVSVKVGAEITPLEVIAEDNLTKTENLTLWTVVYDERGRFISATQGSFVLKEKGRYTVYIHCKDESGNSASVNYEVYAR